MRKEKRIVSLFFLLLGMSLYVYRADAQSVGIKTNVLYGATTTPNLGLEVVLGKKTTLDIAGGYNPWLLSNKEDNKKIKHWLVQPELRLWNCEAFNRSYWGFHALYGRYNMGNITFPLDLFQGMKNNRYERDAVGAGVSYGYQWYLGNRWNLEATFGFGYAYFDYKRFDCIRCGEYQGKGHKHYLGPTKVGVSVIYLIKSKKYPL